MQGLKDMMKQMTHPPRLLYDANALQDQAVVYTEDGQSALVRHDLQVTNNLGHVLECSHYRFPDQSKDILLYCHSLGNCRLEAMGLLQIVAELGMELFIFDFRAHGLSQGEKISYGVNEADDIHAVVQHIHRNLTQTTQRVALFGKSMGAVASIIYSSQYNWNQQVSCLILDSPFLSFQQTVVSVAQKKTFMPKFLLEQFIRLVIPNLEKENSFRVRDLEIAQYIQGLTVPIVFVASRDDSIIPYAHIQKLHSLSKGPKVLKLIAQDHGEARDYFDYQEVLGTHLPAMLAKVPPRPKANSHRYSIQHQTSLSRRPSLTRDTSITSLSHRHHTQQDLPQHTQQDLPQRIHLHTQTVEVQSKSIPRQVPLHSQSTYIPTQQLSRQSINLTASRPAIGVHPSQRVLHRGPTQYVVPPRCAPVYTSQPRHRHLHQHSLVPHSYVQKQTNRLSVSIQQVAPQDRSRPNSFLLQSHKTEGEYSLHR